MSPRAVALLVVVIALVFLGTQAIYTVNPKQQAIVLQFGDPRRVTEDPGLYFKTPLVQNVVILDKRLMELDQAPQEVIASDQERLIVDAFARFQITDPQRFYATVNNLRNARERLSGFLNSNMRRVLGGFASTQIVSGQRAALMDLIEAGVNQEAESARLGVVIRDVRIRRVDLPQANSQAVYERMRSERQQEAAQYRAEGEEKARRIRAEAERNQTVIRARAREQGEITRGQGDALRNAIFACSFGADPDFFAFYRSMQAYEAAFQSQDTTMVLSPNSDFFRFFLKTQRGAQEEAVQQPPSQVSQVARNDPRCSADGSYDLSGVNFLAISQEEMAPGVALPTTTETPPSRFETPPSESAPPPPPSSGEEN
jgi:membrane protease subunit HflC